MTPRRRWLSAPVNLRAATSAAFALALCAAAIANAGCQQRSDSLDDAAQQARSQVAASQFLLQKYASGDSTPQFTSASLKEYTRALDKSLAAMRKAKPRPGTDAAPLLKAASDAREIIRDTTTQLTRDAAASAARMLDEQLQELTS